MCLIPTIWGRNHLPSLYIVRFCCPKIYCYTAGMELNVVGMRISPRCIARTYHTEQVGKEGEKNRYAWLAVHHLTLKMLTTSRVYPRRFCSEYDNHSWIIQVPSTHWCPILTNFSLPLLLFPPSSILQAEPYSFHRPGGANLIDFLKDPFKFDSIHIFLLIPPAVLSRRPSL